MIGGERQDGREQNQGVGEQKRGEGWAEGRGRIDICKPPPHVAHRSLRNSSF